MLATIPHKTKQRSEAELVMDHKKDTELLEVLAHLLGLGPYDPANVWVFPPFLATAKYIPTYKSH